MPVFFQPPTARIDPIGRLETIGDVLAAFEKTIDWAERSQTPIGYFAVIYRQATLAIHQAIEAGDCFEHDEWMRTFQLTFARRYFEALDLYNGHDGGVLFPFRSLLWQKAFHSETPDDPIIFQHLLTALNAHMNLDLGVAAVQAARAHELPIEPLRSDFDLVNAVLGSQVDAVLDVVEQVSPRIKTIRRWLFGADVEIFEWLIIQFRDMAWAFALRCAAQPDMDPAIERCDLNYLRLTEQYLYPPPVADDCVRQIAAEESRDVVGNIAALRAVRPPQWETVVDYRAKLDALTSA
ncbi:DUF5995 family protein [Mycobacterium sp. SMC-4]|uniref:DUF5995 family protein n=1 Tax=Mycobacterium sp. SMC-4 TaxID=2857059 RepID=UPI003D00B9D6